MSKANRSNEPSQLYQALMTNIRARYEIMETLNLTQSASFAQFETAAFHLRKSIEGIAFGCLVAIDQGLKSVPRDAKGQWNADNIFARLKKLDDLVFPEACTREDPSASTPIGVSHHIVKNAKDNLSIDDVRTIYRRSHKWLHEWNPYVTQLSEGYEQSKADLIDDAQRIWKWIVFHLIGIGGHVFLGVLKDSEDNQVHVVSAKSNFLESL